MKNAPLIVLVFLSGLNPLFAQQAHPLQRMTPPTVVTAEQQQIMNRIREMKAEIDLWLLKLPPSQRKSMLDLLSQPPDTSMKFEKPVNPFVTETKPVQGEGTKDLRFLSVFDANKDGNFDSADPSFRVFRLWIDKNGDGEYAYGELQPISDFVARIPLSTLTFVTYNGSTRSIRADSTVMLDMLGNGFGNTLVNTDDACLSFDATSLQPYGFTMLSQDGSVLQGVQTIRPGLMVETPDGKRTLLY